MCTQSIELWHCGGGAVEFKRKDFGEIQLVNRAETGEERDALIRAVVIELRARIYQERDILANQTALVDHLGETTPGFEAENIENLHPDPSTWTIEQCREWLDDNFSDADYPDALNPWDLTRLDLVLELEAVGIECYDYESEDTLRKTLIVKINDETIDGLERWRDAVQMVALPAEIYEWYLVTNWLANHLKDIGEPVLFNDYGCWWGRTCTGQSLLMDGTLQEIASQFDT